MAYEAQGLRTAILKIAPLIQEQELLNNCERVHVSKLPRGNNVIDDHVIYRMSYLKMDRFSAKCE